MTSSAPSPNKQLQRTVDTVSRARRKCAISLCRRGALDNTARRRSTAALGGTDNVMRKVFCLWLLGCSASWAADPSDLEFVVASSLPTELGEYLRASTGHDSYALASWMNPYYIQADFNGDGRADIAVLVREKATDKGGVLIVHFGVNEHFVVGAGNSFDNGRDSFSGMDAWHAQARGVVAKSAHVEGEPPSLLGDALLVIKTEAASGLVYWTGTEYAWYQQGD